VSCLRVSGFREFLAIPVSEACRHQRKDIRPGLGIHGKPIRDLLRRHTLSRYSLHKPFQPPGEYRSWRNQKSYLNGLGLYAVCAWLAREKADPLSMIIICD
jgi:hypothetical protein